jgi:hypothetical protein
MLVLDVIFSHSKILHLDRDNSSMAENSASTCKISAAGRPPAKAQKAQEMSHDQKRFGVQRSIRLQISQRVRANSLQRAKLHHAEPESDCSLFEKRSLAHATQLTLRQHHGALRLRAQWKMFLIGENTREGSVLGS